MVYAIEMGNVLNKHVAVVPLKTASGLKTERFYLCERDGLSGGS